MKCKGCAIQNICQNKDNPPKQCISTAKKTSPYSNRFRGMALQEHKIRFDCIGNSGDFNT